MELLCYLCEPIYCMEYFFDLDLTFLCGVYDDIYEPCMEYGQFYF
jgi:hypothetical protein